MAHTSGVDHGLPMGGPHHVRSADEACLCYSVNARIVYFDHHVQ